MTEKQHDAAVIPLRTGNWARDPISGRVKTTTLREFAAENGWEWEVSPDGHHFAKDGRSLFVTYYRDIPSGGTLREKPGRGQHVQARSLRPILAGLRCKCDPAHLDEFFDAIRNPECEVAH